MVRSINLGRMVELKARKKYRGDGKTRRDANKFGDNILTDTSSIYSRCFQ